MTDVRVEKLRELLQLAQQSLQAKPRASDTLLGVTRTAFLWRVVDMSHKPGARNILLCKRSFTPELLHRIYNQLDTVTDALCTAIKSSVVYTTRMARMVHNGLEVSTGSDDHMHDFIHYLIEHGYDTCNAIVRSPDDYLPPKNFRFFGVFADRYMPILGDYTHGFPSNIYMYPHTDQDMFDHEPSIEDPDYHDHGIFYIDTDNETLG